MPRLSPLTLTALAILALVALSLSMAGFDARAAIGPVRAYLPIVGCEDCAGRATSPTPRPSPSATPSPSVYAARMVELVNQARAAVNCPAVTSHDALMRGAQAWSEKMARESIYEHSGSSYYESFGYPYGPLENIGTGETPEYALEGWMQSPSHKRNLEWCYPPSDPSYDPAMVYDVGVGYAWPGYWTLTIGNHIP